MRSFYNFTLSGFICHGVRRGLKFKLFSFFIQSLLFVKYYLKSRIALLPFLFYVVKRIRPWIYFRIAKFKRRRVIYVPRVLTYRRSIRFAYHWFFKAAVQRLGYSPSLQFFLELIYTFKKKSKSIALRKQAHLLAFSYKKNIRRPRPDKHNIVPKLIVMKIARKRLAEIAAIDFDKELLELKREELRWRMGYRRTIAKFRGVRRLKSGFFDRRHYFIKRDAEIARVKKRIEKALKDPALLLGRRFSQNRDDYEGYNRNRKFNNRPVRFNRSAKFDKSKKNNRRRPVDRFEVQSRFVRGILSKKKQRSRYRKYPLFNFTNLFKKFNV